MAPPFFPLGGHVQFYFSSRAVLIRSYMLFKMEIETYTDYTHTIIFPEGRRLVSDRGQAFFVWTYSE